MPELVRRLLSAAWFIWYRLLFSWLEVAMLTLNGAGLDCHNWRSWNGKEFSMETSWHSLRREGSLYVSMLHRASLKLRVCHQTPYSLSLLLTDSFQKVKRLTLLFGSLMAQIYWPGPHRRRNWQLYCQVVSFCHEKDWSLRSTKCKWINCQILYALTHRRWTGTRSAGPRRYSRMQFTFSAFSIWTTGKTYNLHDKDINLTAFSTSFIPVSASKGQNVLPDSKEPSWAASLSPQRFKGSEVVSSDCLMSLLA